jgi:hypothetical protein
MMFVPHRKHMYGPPQPGTVIVLHFICRYGPYLTGNTRMGLYGLLRRWLYILYVDIDRTSQEIHVWASTACYGDSFSFLYVNYVRTSLETHVWASTAFYEDNFSLYM